MPDGMPLVWWILLCFSNILEAPDSVAVAQTALAPATGQECDSKLLAASFVNCVALLSLYSTKP